MCRSRRYHEVVRFRMLQDAPHRLDIFWRPSPIALDREVAEFDGMLPARSNAAGGADDFPRDKALGAKWRFMIEQDAIGRKQAVGIAIIGHRPMCACFGDGVGA